MLSVLQQLFHRQRLVVKHTFLEVVEEPEHAHTRRRHLSDSALCRSLPELECVCLQRKEAAAVPKQEEALAARLPTLLGSVRGAAEKAEKPAVLAEAPVAAAAVAEQQAAAGEQRTTVMLRNLPNNYTREHMFELLDNMGLAGEYDFLYLPIDFRTGAALGYAFVNLASPAAARRAWAALDGFCRWSLPSRKVCSVSWSDPHQGLGDNVDRYRNSPVMHPSVPDAHKPVVFCQGKRTAFPEPTKALRAPRLRRQQRST